MKIYLIAILRVCFPGIKDRELKEEYENSFLSEFYPGVALSKNTVSKFFSDLGKAFGHIVKFMRNRAAKIGIDDAVIVGGHIYAYLVYALVLGKSYIRPFSGNIVPTIGKILLRLIQACLLFYSKKSVKCNLDWNSKVIF